MNQAEYIAKCARDLGVSEARVWRAIEREGPKRRSVWPCGCITDTVSDNFVIEPCSMICHIYEASVQLTHERGMTVTHIVDPEVTG